MQMHDDDRSIAQFSSWWRSVARPDFGPFGWPEWAQLYRKNLGACDELRLLEISRDGAGPSDEPAALIPMELGAGGTMRFIGGTEVTDYAGPVCRRADTELAATGLAEWLASHPAEWREAVFEAIPEDIGFAAQFEAASQAAGLRAECSTTEVCAVIELPQSFDDYLAALSKKERHELRRKRNRFNRDIGDARLVQASPGSLADDLELFFSWHREALGDKGDFMSDEMEQFFAGVAGTFSEAGWLRLDFVEAAGVRYAASFGFCDGERHYLYNSAFRQDARSLSPGMVMFWLLLESGLDEGLSRLDFLQGDERYKFQLGAVARPLQSVKVAHA